MKAKLFLILIISLAGIVMLPGCKKKGCTDSAASNYDPDAEKDDGSCITITDIDGNAYHTVIIGTQEWMVENLKTSHYRDGSDIPNLVDDNSWMNTTSGAYSFYLNDQANNSIYGKLYNWYALADSRGLCPQGWHIPSDNEWKTLEMFLGMSQADADSDANIRGTDEGGKLKSTSSLWSSSNTGATNSSGFSALPGGFRFDDGGYLYEGIVTGFWSSTEYDSNEAWSRGLMASEDVISRAAVLKAAGYSCRCLKD